MIGTSIFSMLSALNTSVALGLANDNGTLRIYPNYVKMEDDKTVAQQLVFDQENYQADGSLDGNPQTASIDMKIMAIDPTYTEASNLARAIATALDQTRGTWGTTTVQACYVDEISESHFIDTDMSTILYYISEITCKVKFVL